MANPFAVNTISPLQSLMAMQEGFKTSRGFLRDDLELQDRDRAMQEQQRAQGRDQNAFSALLEAAYGGQPLPPPQVPEVTNGAVSRAFNQLDNTNGYFNNIRSAESGGNDLARNPRSTATGRYQFTQGTWDSLARKYPSLGLTPDGRTDPAQQEAAIRAFTADNATALKAYGLDATPGNLYAAHFLGAGDAPRVLQAPENTALSALLSPKVLEANPSIARMNAGQFKRWAAGKGGGGAAPQGQQPANGLPPREVMQAILASPETRKFGIEMIQSAREGREPDNVVIASKLVNKSTGQVVADFTADGGIKPTSDIQEYQFAQTQGFPGTFLEYQTQKRGKGTRVEVGPDGYFSFSQGDVEPLELGKAASTEVEKDILGIDEQLRGLDQVAQQYEDEFLTYGGQLAAGADSTLNKLTGGDYTVGGLGTGERAAKRIPFIQSVNRLFNAYRKEITGAAAAVQELESLKKAMLNTDLSPAEFKSAYAAYKQALMVTRDALLESRRLGLRPAEKNALINDRVLSMARGGGQPQVVPDAAQDTVPAVPGTAQQDNAVRIERGPDGKLRMVQ